MVNFFKSFGRGVLYVLVLPVLLAGMAIYAVIALIMFIIIGIKAIVLFFTGRSLYSDLPEDVEAKKILAQANGEVDQKEVETVVSTPIIESKSLDNDPFYVPEYLKDEGKEIEDEPTEIEQTVAPQIGNTIEPIEEDSFEEEPDVETEVEPKIEPENKELFTEETIEKEPISTQKSTQNANIFDVDDAKDYNEDEDPESGININFE